MSGSSGDGNGSMVSSGEEPIEGTTMLQLYYIYCIAIGCLLLLGLIVLILLLIIKQRRCKKDKIRDECDEYEDVFDQTILELFETLDMRNRPPQNKSSLSVETNFGSSVSDSTNNHVHLTKTIVSLESCQLKSPNSINKSNSFNATPAVDMSLLKPLGHTKETFTSADSVYDKLTESTDSSQDITQLQEENTYKNVKAALSPRVSPNHQPEHIYDNTVESLLEKKQRKHMKGRQSLTTPTIPLTTLSQDETLYTIPASFKNDNEDIEGYYIIPDNFPPSKYAYSSTHKLVSSPDSNMGEVRCQNEHKPISKNEHGQTCTATDDVNTRSNTLNSLTCDFKEHRNATQTGREFKNTDKANGHDCNPSHSQKEKSSSLPRNTSETMRDLHTYANVSQFTKALNSSDLPQEELQNGSVNPLYSTRNSPINKKDDSSLAFHNHLNELKKRKAKTLGHHTSSGAVATDPDQDYLSNTSEWLEQARKQARLKNSLNPTIPQQLETCSSQDTDHIYMGILVRERESHDYSSPKRMVSFSSSSKMKTMPEGVRMTRALSLDNPNCIFNDRKYENQAMWLSSPSNGAAKTDGFDRQTSSSGYMDLSCTGYETHYTNLKMSGNSQQ